MPTQQKSFMEIALEEAKLAAKRGEVPVGAVIVKNGRILTQTGNRMIETRDPTAHAEIVALRDAAKILDNERLYECDLYVTLEPCTMCAGAISLARVRRLYFGAFDEKGGAVESGVRFFKQATCHHRPDVYSGILQSECEQLLKDFFQQRRS